ncbi:MAG: class I SAM-dependent methyltransferase [Acidimicrobiia bacterium]
MSHPEAAEWYERGKESWLLEDLAKFLSDAAKVGTGDRVLDVGCGTGVVARECARRVGEEGNVAGIDISEEMLAVARRIAPELDWYLGDAVELPFPDGAFDRAVSQFALMFFPDREKALTEMWRVLRPGGTLAVGVPGGIPPAYQRLAELASRNLDSDASHIIESRFVLGHPGKLKRIFSGAGLEAITLETVEGVQRFRSPAVFVEMEVRATSRLAARFDDTSVAAFATDVEAAIQDHLTGDGEVEIPVSAHIVTAAKPST